MRKLATFASLVLASLALPVTAATAQDALVAEDVSPNALRVAREVVDAMYPPETREDSLVAMAQSMGAQVAGTMDLDVIEDAGARRVIEESLAQGLADMRPLLAEHIPVMLEATAVAYADTFALAELVAIRDFSRTLAGSAFFERSTSLVSHPALVAVNEPYFQQIQVFSRTLQMQIINNLESYFLEQEEDRQDPA